MANQGGFIPGTGSVVSWTTGHWKIGMSMAYSVHALRICIVRPIYYGFYLRNDPSDIASPRFSRVMIFRQPQWLQIIAPSYKHAFKLVGLMQYEGVMDLD